MLRLLFVEADDLAAVGATFFVGALDAMWPVPVTLKSTVSIGYGRSSL
jgi:hypothetical protein